MKIERDIKAVEQINVGDLVDYTSAQATCIVAKEYDGLYVKKNTDRFSDIPLILPITLVCLQTGRILDAYANLAELNSDEDVTLLSKNESVTLTFE